MRRLNRYISRSVFMSTLVVLFVLAGIDLLSLVITESRGIDDQYTFSKVMQYVAWLVPSTLVEWIDRSAFLGCVIGLGIHANANELVVIRAAGVGMRRLMWAVFRPVIFLAVVGLIMNEYVTPLTLQQAEAVQEVAKGKVKTLQANHGNWHVERNPDSGNTVFIFFRGLNRNLFDVVRYELDATKKQLAKSSFAEEALYYSAEGWWLEQSETSTIPATKLSNIDIESMESEQVDYETYVRQSWNTSLTPDLVNDLALLPEQLATSRLYLRASNLDQQGLDSRPEWLAFWQKIFQPLSIVSLTLVGISFVFGSMREITIAQRTTVALLVGIVFSIFQELLSRSALVYQFSPLIAVFVPIALCLLVGVRMLKRT